MKKLLAIALLAFAGCADVTPEEQAAWNHKQALKRLELPPKAENVVILDENDGWHTYELVIDGQRRKFLRQSSGWGDCRMTSNVELVPR